MKILEIYRGKSTVNHKCTNGDIYDSSATLIDPVATGPRAIWHSELVNTDSTEGYNGGKLAKGEYYGIVGYRAAKDGTMTRKVIKLFKATDEELAKITKYDQLTVQMMTLPSEIPNPNHEDKYIIQYVQVHDGFRTSDGSHGCITVYKYALVDGQTSEWDLLINMLQDNEIIKIKLT